MSAKPIWEMTDEELLNADPSEFMEAGDSASLDSDPADNDPDEDQGEVDSNANAGADAGEQEDAGEVDEGEGGGEEQASSAAGQELDSDEAKADADEEGEKSDGAGEADPGAVPGTEKAQAPAATDQDEAAGSKQKDASENQVDYKGVVDRLFAPFKANGKEMRVDNVEDAIQLMQMGANYNKKMAALKPNLRLLKMLENNGVLSEEKLSFLIDLEKKKPAAIAKLVKESGLDPLEMDQEKGEYKPSTYTVDERELKLDEVLDKLQHTPTFQRMIDVVSNKWDGPSKQAAAQSPELLEVINEHMGAGIYDLISNEMERQRMLGRLDGLSDLQAYRRVGDELNAKGAFDNLGQPQPSNQPTPKREVTPRPKPENPDRQDKRRAASPTQTGGSTGTKPAAEYNPLAMSDEDFDKQVLPKLL